MRLMMRQRAACFVFERCEACGRLLRSSQSSKPHLRRTSLIAPSLGELGQPETLCACCSRQPLPSTAADERRILPLQGPRDACALRRPRATVQSEDSWRRRTALERRHVETKASSAPRLKSGCTDDGKVLSASCAGTCLLGLPPPLLAPLPPRVPMPSPPWNRPALEALDRFAQPGTFISTGCVA